MLKRLSTLKRKHSMEPEKPRKKPKIIDSLISETSLDPTIDKKTLSEMNIVPKFSSEEHGDRVIMVGGEKYHVYYHILSLWSSFFQHELKENESLCINEVNPKDMEEFLLQLYPPCCVPITPDNVEVLIRMAERFDVNELRNKCIMALLDMKLNFDIVVLADELKKYEKGKSFYVKATNWMIENYQAFMSSPYAEKISKECIIYITRGYIKKQKKFLFWL